MSYIINVVIYFYLLLTIYWNLVYMDIYRTLEFLIWRIVYILTLYYINFIKAEKKKLKVDEILKITNIIFKYFSQINYEICFNGKFYLKIKLKSFNNNNFKFKVVYIIRKHYNALKYFNIIIKCLFHITKYVHTNYTFITWKSFTWNWLLSGSGYNLRIVP